MLFWDFQHSKSDILISKKQVPKAGSSRKLMIAPSANKHQEKTGEKIHPCLTIFIPAGMGALLEEQGSRIEKVHVKDLYPLRFSFAKGLKHQ